MTEGLRVTDFHCYKCGAETDMAPDPPNRAVCENCCDDHDYRYQPDVRQHACDHCGKYCAEDWGR